MFAPPAPAPAPEPLRAPPTPSRRRAWTARLLTLVVLAAVVALVVRERDRRATDPVRIAESGAVGVTHPLSFTQPGRLRRALAAVAGASPGPLTSLRITPIAVDAEVQHPDGSRTQVAIDPALRATLREGTPERSAGLPVASVPVDLPQSLLRRAAAELELYPANLDYVLLNIPTGSATAKPTWGLYFSRPTLDNDATAAFDGTDLRLTSQPSAAVRAANAR